MIAKESHMQLALEDQDAYLSSDESPERCMKLSDFDGFLTGVACTASPIEDWMDVAFGDAQSVPPRIVALAEARLHSIREDLSKQSVSVEPVFWQVPEGHVIAMDWCEGVMEAVKLRPDVWERFSKTEIGARSMIPILAHMFDDQGNSALGFPQEEMDEMLAAAAVAIPQVVPAKCKQL